VIQTEAAPEVDDPDLQLLIELFFRVRPAGIQLQDRADQYSVAIQLFLGQFPACQDERHKTFGKLRGGEV
jgi:hypothetical protein